MTHWRPGVIAPSEVTAFQDPTLLTIALVTLLILIAFVFADIMINGSRPRHRRRR